jgi:hypothetical protein
LSKRTVGVVYLAWHALGCDVFRQFAESYRRFSAGCEHDLIVIYAGFQTREELDEAIAVFRDIPHVRVEFPDIRFDIGYYLETARRVSHEYLCFLNTYAKLVTPNWLALLYKHISRDDVGLVGTTGSYESLFDSFGLYQKAIWVSGLSGTIAERADHYLGFILSYNCPNATVEPAIPTPRSSFARWKTRVVQYIRDSDQDVGFREHWKTLTAPGMVFADYLRFPPFPNPHVRSSGFMVRRAQLLEFDPSEIKTKYDACAFESGIDSLTARVRRQGLAALIVANDGQGYDVADWWRSGTFRQQKEEGLVLADNRSGEFLQMPAGERLTHLRITWGDYLQPAPADFPDFGYKFSKGGLDAQSAPRISPRSLAFDPIYLGCRFVVWLAQLKARARAKLTQAEARTTAADGLQLSEAASGSPSDAPSRRGEA